MAKVTFEFNDEEDNNEIILVANRHRLAYALNEVANLYRALYNGKLYTEELVTIKDGKVLTDEDYEKFRETGEYPVKGTKEYLSVDYLENKLDIILDNIRDFLD